MFQAPYSGYLASLGLNLLGRRDFDGAEPALRECLTIRDASQPGHWTTANTRSMLGEALAGLGRFDEGEPLVLAGQRGLEEQADAIPAVVRDIRQREAVERLVRLYESWGQPEQAARWRREVAALRAEPALPDEVFAGPNDLGTEAGAEPASAVLGP